MKIRFLGTAAAEGWPGLFCECKACLDAMQQGGKDIRTRSSCIIDDRYLIDFPVDTYMHIVNNRLDIRKIRHLIVTHSHMDHFYPTDLSLRKPPYAHIADPEPLHIYGNDKVKARFCGLSGGKPEAPGLFYHEVFPFEPFPVGNMNVTPLLADHDRSEKCYLYIFELGGRKLLYGHDSGIFPEPTWEALQEHYFHGVILDCTEGPRGTGTFHMGLPDNVRVKKKLLEQGMAGPETAFYITHFSHNGGLLHAELSALAEPLGFTVAYDGAEFVL